MTCVVGIDPGWASFGIARQGKGSLVKVDSYIPRDYASTKEFLEILKENYNKPDMVFIERFVAYQGVHSDASEQILMLIGAVRYFYELQGVQVFMVRAIDWKPALCKYLVRNKGFNNPYPGFDKKYSILAAKEISGEGIARKVDHEADAICLSYLNFLGGK